MDRIEVNGRPLSGNIHTTLPLKRKSLQHFRHYTNCCWTFPRPPRAACMVSAVMTNGGGWGCSVGGRSLWGCGTMADRSSLELSPSIFGGTSCEHQEGEIRRVGSYMKVPIVNSRCRYMCRSMQLLWKYPNRDESVQSVTDTSSPAENIQFLLPWLCSQLQSSLHSSAKLVKHGATQTPAKLSRRAYGRELLFAPKGSQNDAN